LQAAVAQMHFEGPQHQMEGFNVSILQNNNVSNYEVKDFKEPDLCQSDKVDSFR
jgi:hypothetical protein